VGGPSELIAPHAIITTIVASVANARKRGDPWKALAEEYLGPTEALLKRIDAMGFELLRRHAAPARAMSEMNEKVLTLLERLAESVWEDRGQLPQDPLVGILSSGMPSFFFDWEVGRPADRLEVMLELLEGDLDLTGRSEDTKAAVESLRALLPEFRAMNEETRAFRAKSEVLDKMAGTIARAGHVQYSRLRRKLRNDGFDRSDILAVFPDIQGVPTAGTMG
jgi:hypothetical protein